MPNRPPTLQVNGSHYSGDSAVNVINLFVLHGFCTKQSFNSLRELKGLTPSVSSKVARKF